MSQKSYDGSPTLYLIPTPIGNMEDITIRAINTLKLVDVIFCEDTRVTGMLLKHFEINKKLISSHKYNEDKNKEKLLEYLDSGKNIGVVSDRGTPAISDPGFILARIAIENNYNVVSLPGPTALIPALTSSGFDTSSFYFYGFLNSKAQSRKKELEKLKNITSTLIFYEAPHRINSTLNDISKIFGENRKISISREISKRFEEIYRGTISEVLKNIDNFKGEFVLVIEGNNNVNNFENISIEEHVKYYVDLGNSLMDSIKIVSKERKVKKSEIYAFFHKK